MKIAYDAKRAFNNHSGLGNYSRYVIAAMMKYYPDNNYFLYTPRKKITFEESLGQYKASMNVVSPSFFSSIFHSIWRTYLIPFDLKNKTIDIYHGLSNEIPSGLRKNKIKSVVTIHDLIFLRYPELYNIIDRWIYKRKFYFACKEADKIIAISEQTKQDIIDFFAIDSEKIEVIYQDCNNIYHSPATDQERQDVLKKWQLPSNYLLCVATLEPRKNQLLILKSFEQLFEKYPDLHVVLVGKPRAYKDLLLGFLKGKKYEARVHFIEQVSVHDLRLIYQCAAMLVYPSIFEGFGIPILEGLNSGIPVITSTGSCFHEAGGAASIYVDPSDENALTMAVDKILTDETFKKSMVEKGFLHAMKFRDSVSAKRMMELYSELLMNK